MILSYGVRSLLARWRVSLFTAFVIVAITATIATVVGVVRGLRHATLHSGDEAGALVLAGSRDQEVRSHLPVATVHRVETFPGLRTDGQRPLASPELIERLPVLDHAGHIELLIIRGVDPVAFEVRPSVHVEQGAAPRRGEDGFLVGRRLMAQHPELAPGGKLSFGRYSWPIVGVLSGAGCSCETELWADRAAASTAFRRADINVVRVRLDSPARQADFAAAAATVKDTPLTALSEQAYAASMYRLFTAHVDVLYAVVAVVFIGAVFAGTNLLYVSFLSRLGELATLMAIGYRRRRVAVLLLSEGLLLGVVAGAVGVLLVRPLASYQFEITAGTPLIVSIDMGMVTMAVGLLVAVAVTLVASLISIVQCFHLDIIRELRKG